LRQQPGPDGQAPATTPPQTAHTNDRGEFRLKDLAEGSYLLFAAPLSPRPVVPLPAPALVLAPTYYPGTPDKETAEAVTVVSGQALDYLQFSMLMLPAHEVSGVVVDEGGAPVAGVFVVLTADSTTDGPGRPATRETDQNGAFRFAGIVSGTYRLIAETRGRRVARSGPSPSAGVDAIGPTFLGASAPRRIAVSDTDATGLRLVLPAIPAGRAKPITGPVKPTEVWEAAEIIGLTILPDVREIKVGDTVEFRAELQLTSGFPPKIAPPPPGTSGDPLWETDNPAVAAVTRTGGVTALAPGELTLSVRYFGMTATRMLRIIP
jgi:Carboxypeptidase regulatory-like domain/Bacterial Ig-like domain (group 2)